MRESLAGTLATSGSNNGVAGGRSEMVWSTGVARTAGGIVVGTVVGAAALVGGAFLEKHPKIDVIQNGTHLYCGTISVFLSLSLSLCLSVSRSGTSPVFRFTM
jgi:hypothetical protein